MNVKSETMRVESLEMKSVFESSEKCRYRFCFGQHSRIVLINPNPEKEKEQIQ